MDFPIRRNFYSDQKKRPLTCVVAFQGQNCVYVKIGRLRQKVLCRWKKQLIKSHSTDMKSVAWSCPQHKVPFFEAGNDNSSVPNSWRFSSVKLDPQLVGLQLWTQLFKSLYKEDQEYLKVTEMKEEEGGHAVLPVNVRQINSWKFGILDSIHWNPCMECRSGVKSCQSQSLTLKRFKILV